MSPSRAPIGDDDLQAYVDGRLPSERGREVEDFLSGQPEAAARVSAYQQQKAELRARLEPLAQAPIPARVRIATIRGNLRSRQRYRLVQMAAALGLLMVGAVGGWITGKAVDGSTPGRPLPAAEALAAHRTFVVEVMHPVEVRANQEQHLIGWLSRRLGRDIRIPDLTAHGFRLMGGRLLPTADGAAAQLMYDNDRGTRLTLYVRTVNGAETAFRFVNEQGVSGFYWVERGLSYAIMAELEREQLLLLAEATYQQLGFAPGPGR